MTSRLPLVDLRRQYEPLRRELGEAFERVASSGVYVLGPEVARFESAIARLVDVPHAVGVSSGTDALLAALIALEVGPGHEVITTPYSFFATVECILRVGARPVFVDVDPTSYTLAPSAVAEAITSRTAAILPVHLFGEPADMTALGALAAERSVAIVEDAAQALGATWRGAPVGGLGDVGCFSFFPTKNLGAFGDAGMVTTRRAELAERLRALRVHGATRRNEHASLGGNFRLDELQAALLLVKLEHLAVWNVARRGAADRYDRAFAASGLGADQVAVSRRSEGHVLHHYVVRSTARDDLRAHLRAEGIETGVYYPEPLHRQPVLRRLGYEAVHLPNAERAARESLALPVFPGITDAEIDRVVASVEGFFSR